MLNALEMLGKELANHDVRSVLDVGAGDGALHAHIPSGAAYLGVDLGPHNVESMRGRGIPAARGNATDLGAAEASVEAVVLSHVLHHLNDPGAAVDEAWRVASRVVAVAEPWFEPDHTLYEVSVAIDAWSKRVHRAVGATHHPGLPPADVVRLLRGKGATSVVTHYLPPRASAGG